MDRVDRKLYERQVISTAPFEAGPKEIFRACHEPLPKQMEELIRRLEESEKQTRH